MSRIMSFFLMIFIALDSDFSLREVFSGILLFCTPLLLVSSSHGSGFPSAVFRHATFPFINETEYPGELILPSSCALC